MAKSALIIGNALNTEAAVTSVLGDNGFDGASSVEDVVGAIPLVSLGHIDVVFVAIDALDDSEVAQLDRAVRLSDRTEVIATAPSAQPDLMLRAMRGGIQEYLVRPVKPAELTAALDRVGRRHGGSVSGSIFAVYGAKGGVGVSSVAANLAYALSVGAKGRKVVIADFVVPSGEQRLQFNAKVAYDLRDVATKPERVDQELLSSVLAPIRDGLWLLASSDDPEVDEILDAGVTTAILKHLRTGYHYTVVDCDGYLNDRTLTILDQADRILMVTQLNVSALRSAQRSLGIFRRLGYPEEKLTIIVNRHQSGEVISLGDAKEVLGAEPFFRLPNDYKIMADAVARGLPAAEVDPAARISVAFGELARKLAGGDRPDAVKGEKKLLGIFSRKK